MKSVHEQINISIIALYCEYNVKYNAFGELRKVMGISKFRVLDCGRPVEDKIGK